MDFSFLGEGWDFFKRTWRAALGLWGFFLLVVGVPFFLSMRQLVTASRDSLVPPSAPGPLFWVAVVVNFLMMPAMYWATILIASSPGAGELPRAFDSLREGFRHWRQAMGLGLTVMIGSLVPMLLLIPVPKVIGQVGSLVQSVYSGVVLVYAWFALLNLVRVPSTGVLDAVRQAITLIPKTRWLRTVGAIVLLGLIVQLLSGAMAVILFRMAGLPMKVQDSAQFSAVFGWVFVANLPMIAFSWYQLLCVVSLWWRFQGLKAVTRVASAGQN